MSASFKKRTILICRGTGCNSLNADILHENLVNLIEENNLSNFIKIKLTGCHGFCQIGPTLIVEPEKILYVNLKEKDLNVIVEKHLKNNEIVEELLYKDPKTGKFIPIVDKIQFYMALVI